MNHSNKSVDLALEVLEFASIRAREEDMDGTDTAAALMSATSYKLLEMIPDKERLIFPTAVMASSAFRTAFVSAQKCLIDLNKQVRHG